MAGSFRRVSLILSAFVILAAGAQAQAPQDIRNKIQVRVDASEAEAVLSILEARRTGRTAAAKDWERLFATEPYRRLKRRESSMKRDFTDQDFKSFVLSPDLAKSESALRTALAAWRKADIEGSARRILPYLPPQAGIKAAIYIVIKPRTNSFVFELLQDPTIFLYLDPKISAAKFENTVAHELHHVGLASVSAESERVLAGLPPRISAAVDWMGSFGEGLAMLAAAGSPDIHPHAASAPDERERWDRDMANAGRDLKDVEAFFLDIIQGRLSGKESIREKAMAFFGIQGPWYTVGYAMAVLVEKTEGRAALIECMVDPRQLLIRYNRAAEKWNAAYPDKKPLWSAALLAAISPEMK
jgi:hypothetical protein